ncbi:MAG TPA: ankyrin repeat domain-containing protein [Patescibacteria group bacterium]|nr:ankyrin repeat domain-containing protein [Patescibacteria group bacterium]
MPVDRELATRLLNAVNNGNADLARQLLNNGAWPLATDAKGQLGTHIAVAREDYSHGKGRELMAMFLNRGVDVNAKDGQGATVLHIASQDESYNATSKMSDVVTFGGDVHARDNQGRTPLHWAAVKSYRTDAVSFLINKRADVNAVDERGVTPLHLAAARGDADLIKVLMNAGADIHALTKAGETVWDFAVAGGKDYQAQVLKAEAAKQLREQAQAQERARRIELQPEAPKKPHDPWSLLGPDRVAFSSVEKGVGYKLTEIFNFSARTYTQITHNLGTKSEAVVLKTFDEFSDKTALEKAHEALERLGGTVEKNTIGGPVLDKPKRNLKLPPSPPEP